MARELLSARLFDIFNIAWREGKLLILAFKKEASNILSFSWYKCNPAAFNLDRSVAIHSSNP
jgi:hypothetical protein